MPLVFFTLSSRFRGSRGSLRLTDASADEARSVTTASQFQWASTLDPGVRGGHEAAGAPGHAAGGARAAGPGAAHRPALHAHRRLRRGAQP
eukprot:6220-Prorocentrum_minimum.AAC.1